MAIDTRYPTQLNIMYRCSLPHFKRRITNAALLSFVLCSALRYMASSASDVRLPLTPYAHPEMTAYGGDLAVRYYHTLYFATPARVCNLAIGILVAMCMMSTNATKILKQYRVVVSIASFGAMIALFKIVFFAKLYGHPKEEKNWPHARVFAAFAYHGSPLYAVSFGMMIIAISLHADPLTGLVGRILSSWPVRSFARVRLLIGFS